MAPTEPPRPPAVLVGGIGELYQGDLDVGRRAVERLAGEALGAHVAIEDLSYGAVAVAQRLEELQPGSLVLVGAASRGRPPGTVERRRVAPLALPPAGVGQAVAEAVTGYVSIDLALEVASGLGALPERTVVIEVEPVSRELSDQLSPEIEESLERIVDLVRSEVVHAPVLEAADRLRVMLSGEHLERSPAVQAAARLVQALERPDHEGDWDLAFTLRDVLRNRIPAAAAGEGIRRGDWAVWWALIEELDRFEAAAPESERNDMSENRRSEQGDEVTEEHSIEPKEGKPEQPYRPPRQPAQDQPGEEPAERGGEPGGEAAGDEPRPAPGS